MVSRVCPQRAASMCSGLVRVATRAAHRRATLEVLARARQCGAGGPGAGGPGAGHRWAAAPAAAPARCDHCAELLWGPLGEGARCGDCAALCHERCAELLAAPCARPPPPPPDRDRSAPIGLPSLHYLLYTP